MAENRPVKILIMAAPIGAGHLLAAKALEQALVRYPGVQVVQANVFSFFPRVLGQGFLRCYLQILAWCPWAYAMAYKWGNQQRGSLWLRNLINGALARLAEGFLSRTRPDIVIATHATPCGIMSLYKARYCPQLPLVGVVTDFTVHNWWVCPGVNTYCVAAKEVAAGLKQQLRLADTTVTSDSKGLPPQVEAFGIPLRQNFAREYRSLEELKAAKARAKAVLGLDPALPVVLLMGGGEGLLPMEELVGALQGQRGLQLVAVAGKNRGLESSLREMAAGGEGATLKVYGYTEQVPELLLAAEVLLSKAGGLSAAEALATGVQLIVYRPLPGQESKNTEFLQQHYGVQVAKTLEAGVELAMATANIKEQERLEQQFRRCREYGHPLGAEQIAAYVLAAYGPSKESR